ncbi:FimV/HubP family polar landmark protein [Biformimicrobium ophioploci]|uniref:Motility hub landmark protein FimV n=1 Tax=Biformimicrobium ophioploci TaxID=3036711 RepID=A0ABQ6LZJ2_9GAMM|nr:FimV/HubP family polar landmark protein [Microbulbifer sp. NKW57]GMG87462.1 motility hub landmark protein FimV [Microbulbifer sp. NKW57]
MRVRKLALAVGLVSALGTNAAFSLGLGEIKLKSALNEPLDAEIQLLQTRGLGGSEIRVRLAGIDDFERAGVDRAYFLSSLKFDVVMVDGEPVVRVTSRGPVREPYLNFLVETRWPSGRLLREYTLLMDLPAFGNEPAQPVQAAERERQQIRRQPPQPVQPGLRETGQPEPVSQPDARERTAPEPQPGNSRVFGPVSASDTLWEIARDARPSRDVTIQQTMVAIQAMNPQAFIRGNINLLKRGQVLRLPDEAYIRSIGAGSAVAQVAQQNSEWRNTTGAPLDARSASASDSAEAPVEGRLSLSAPGDNETVQSGAGTGSADTTALRGQLVQTEEELDKTQLENTELRSRVAELEEQIATMERLVEVSSEELRAIQLTSEAAVEESSEADAAGIDTMEEGLSLESPVEEAAAEESASPFAEAVDAPAEESAGNFDDIAADAAEASAEPARVDNRSRVISAPAAPKESLVDTLMANIQYIGGGAAALLLLLAGIMRSRRKKAEEEAIRQIEEEMAAFENEGAEADAGEAEDSLDESLEGAAGQDTGLGEMEIETGDPVAEAEIHLSLGQYAEAEQKLAQGLQSAPENVDARLKLLEVYAQQQDVESFDSHYGQLLQYSDGPVADRAARLRETIAGAAPFVAPEMLNSDSLEAAEMSGSDSELLEFDLGLDSDTADPGSETDEFTLDFDTAEPAVEDDLTLDFSLDDDGPAVADTAADSAVAVEKTDDLSLDFDLDLDAGADQLGEDQLEEDQLEEDQLEEKAAEAGVDEGLDFSLDLDAVGADTQSESVAADLEFDLDLSIDEPAESVAEEETFADGAEGGLDLELDDLDLDGIELPEDTGLELEATLEEPVAKSAVVQEPAVETASADATAVTTDLGDLDFDLEGDLDSELSLMDGSDEVSTKLELAQAYIDMGDKDGAKDILDEVIEEGGDEHQSKAREMLERMT